MIRRVIEGGKEDSQSLRENRSQYQETTETPLLTLTPSALQASTRFFPCLTSLAPERLFMSSQKLVTPKTELEPFTALRTESRSLRSA